MFTGKASGGSVTIKDAFDDTRGNETAHGEVFYSGVLNSGYPNHGSATLFVDPRSCKYQLSIAFGVKTHYAGDADLNPGPNVGGGADGEREKIPHSLHLAGGAGPDAFHSGCQEALFNGTDCYSFGGGYSTDFMTLFDCHSAQAVNCSSGDKPVGSAEFVWVLSPKFFKPKKI